jgi:hypothetical protein
MVIGEVQALNTLGADLIERGDLKQAASALLSAISHLSWCVLSPTPIGAKKTEGRGNFTVYSEDPAEPRSEMFCHPFLFESEEASCEFECSLTSEQHTFCTICILFNIGVSFHLEWQLHKTKSSLLLKASRFYEQALSLADDIVLKPTDSILKVLMAICANATYCHVELGNHDHVDCWNQKLQVILKFSRVQCLSSQEFFSVNAFLNSFRRMAANAA